MGWGNPDVYYDPEKFDLEKVVEFDFSDGCYQFDLRVIWEHKPTGTLYTARDSGCSCPSPFEDYRDLKKLDTVSWEALIDEAMEAQRSEFQSTPVEPWLAELKRMKRNSKARERYAAKA